MFQQIKSKLPGIFLSSFENAQPASALTRELSVNQWELADYVTTHGAGTMLMCRGGAEPPTVTVQPNLTGWHRIHICLASSGYPSAGLTLKLTRDLGASFVWRSFPNPQYPCWCQMEQAEEYFWECADMTGQEVIIEKLHDKSPYTIALLWLRFEPMTEAEVAAYQADRTQTRTRTLHAHTDCDWLGMVLGISRETFAPFVQAMAHSDAELLSVEFYPLLQDQSFANEAIQRGVGRFLRDKQLRLPELVRQAPEVFSWLTEQCHATGRRVYAALRHCLSKCPIPYDYTTISHVAFAEEHPEYYCVDRDGEPFAMLSYAFSEVQDYVITECLKVLPWGFDGITLFFHRGVMTAFEKPILDRFAELYPGVDARLLPLDDPRLVQVHCELMTGFIRKLRKALDDFAHALRNGKRLGLAIVGGYTIEDDVRYGVDVERWAEEGLIDECIAGNMSVFEDVGSYMDPATGLVDLRKYREAKYHAVVPPIRRFYGDDVGRMLQGLPHFQEISRRTGLTVYHEVPWECSREPEFFREYALQLYESGVDRLSLWDAFHARVMNRAEWNLVSRFGHRDELAGMPSDRDGYGTTIRILSLNGLSIAAYHPGWRG